MSMASKIISSHVILIPTTVVIGMKEFKPHLASQRERRCSGNGYKWLSLVHAPSPPGESDRSCEGLFSARFAVHLQTEGEATPSGAVAEAAKGIATPEVHPPHCTLRSFEPS